MNKFTKYLIIALLLTPLASLNAKRLPIGEPVPGFTLSDPDGNEISVRDYEESYVVLEWINHGCPYVQKHYDDGNMQKLQADMKEKGVVWLSICSSAKGKQGYMEGDEWKKVTKEKNAQPTKVLLDPKGKVGKLFEAKTTPHMYVLAPKNILIYQGAIDDLKNFKDDVSKTNNYVIQTIDDAMAGRKVKTPSTKPYGCSVKY